jgi:hypothetical protein
LTRAAAWLDDGEDRVGDLTTDVAGIGSYLSSRRLAIPDYQRSYSWQSEDEVKDLWDDLAQAVRSGQPEYFLGAIVVIRGFSDDRLRVIDGQQRLATVSLLYAALRDIYAGMSDERAQEIQQEVLGKKDRRTRAITQFLTLNAEDNDYFRQITLQPVSDRALVPSADSHVRLQAAYDYLVTQLRAGITGLGASDWPKPLIAWDEFVMNRAMIIEVSVPNESRGFVIFETLNDRGLNLSTADLLKNHLLGTAGARIEEAKLRWARASAPFTTPDSQLDMEVFLRHFWASKKGVVRVKDLFWQMKAEVDSPDSAVRFVDELAEASRLWTAMFDRDSEIWSGYGSAAVDALDTLRNLKVEQCRPLVLSGLRRLAKAEVERLLSLVVNWSVRWIVVGGGSAGTTERLYAITAKKVTDGELTTASQVADVFEASVPSDLAFEQAFSTLRIYRGWLARYYLQVLERASAGDPEPELVPNENVEQVNLEHVVPRNARDSDWPAFAVDELELLANEIGNQALMKKTPNAALGNKPFAVKKAELAKSDFELTRQIGSCPDWTPSDLRARGRRLATTAVSAWPRR